MNYMDALVARADASRAAKETKLTAQEARSLLIAASLSRHFAHPTALAKLRDIVRGGGQ